VSASGALVACLTLAACDGDDPPAGSRALQELERLAFVPAGRSVLQGYAPPWNEFVVAEPLLVDLYEVTRADWGHYFADRRPTAIAEAYDDRPTSWPMPVSMAEALELSEARGMRLLTAREWIHVAIGPRAHPFPWGPSARTSVANTLELGLAHPVAVGTFENGRGPFGNYDLLGNLWEWASDSAPGRGGPSFANPRTVSLMGGSWLYRATPTYALPGDAGNDAVFHALSVDPRTLSPEYGMRCAAEARDYIWRKAPEWGDDIRLRPRLEAVGARFGREALGLLRSLAARPGAPAALLWLAAGADS
jgi:hypothetical protein